jgi:Sec-independent protein secretion pathway component TatC
MNDLHLSSDDRQSINSHLDEFTRRVTATLILFCILTGIWSFSIDKILHWLLLSLDPCSGSCINIFSPDEWAATRWISAALIGLLTTAPFGMMQAYNFARPGLLPSERRMFVIWMVLVWSIGIGALWVTIGELLPWLYSIGHTTNANAGLTGKYDAAQIIRISISISWTIILVLSAISIAIIAGISGLLFKKNASWWRLRIYGIMLMMLWLIVPSGYPGLLICLSLIAIGIVEILGWPFFHADTPTGYGLESLLDKEGKIWRVLYADCSCCGTVDSITALQGMGSIYFNAVCRSDYEQDILLDTIKRFNVNRVVFSGCVLESLPPSLLDSMRFLGVEFSTLNLAHISTMRTTGNPVELEISMAKLTQPWSQNKANHRVMNLLSNYGVRSIHYGNTIPFGLQLAQFDTWICEPDESLLTKMQEIGLQLILHHD